MTWLLPALLCLLPALRRGRRRGTAQVKKSEGCNGNAADAQDGCRRNPGDDKSRMGGTGDADGPGELESLSQP
jgi:hypothetical protein